MKTGAFEDVEDLFCSPSGRRQACRVDLYRDLEVGPTVFKETTHPTDDGRFRALDVDFDDARRCDLFGAANGRERSRRNRPLITQEIQVRDRRRQPAILSRPAIDREGSFAVRYGEVDGSDVPRLVEGDVFRQRPIDLG